MAQKAKIGVLGRFRLYRGGACAHAAAPSARRNRAAHRRAAGGAGDARRYFRSSRHSICRRSPASTGSTGPGLALDVAFCALPHATTQKVIKELLAKAPATKVVDLSADFRLSDTAAYAKWYGHEHHAPELQGEAVYGLTEVHRREIKQARLVANPGCYTTCAQLPLIPLIKNKAIELDEIVVDAKSGMTGAGRAAKEAMLFSEVSEGFNAYGVGHHRHMAELDQEFSLAAGREVIVSFTPHLVPMNRGILSTIYVRGRRGRTPEDLHAILLKAYMKEPFVHVLPFGETPQTRHVRGSNMTFIGVANDRMPGRAIVIAALDNLVKGASGQAIQNMNLIMGWPETMGLEQVALFP